MNTEDKDPLWKLLGEVKTPQVSPFFARNVLREIRGARQEEPSRFPAWLRGARFTWLAGVAAVALACIGVGAFDRKAAPAKDPQGQETLVAQQLAKNPDSDVIKNLDELLASDDNSVWLDNSAN